MQLRPTGSLEDSVNCTLERPQQWVETSPTDDDLEVGSPYDYTVEVTNRFKGLDLTDRVLEELWTKVYDIV